MKRYKAVLFDLDGTLLDTLDDLADAVNFALISFGCPSRTRDEVRAFVGNGVARLIELAAPGGKDRAAILAAFRARYGAHMTDKTKPYPGVTELLSALRARGIACAVVSNKYDAAAKSVCRTCLGDFPAVVIGEGNGIARKPAPDGCLAALRALDVQNEDALYVGDSDVDLRTAENAALDCACVTWGFRSRAQLIEAGAINLCDTPSDLLAHIAPEEERT